MAEVPRLAVVVDRVFDAVFPPVLRRVNDENWWPVAGAVDEAFAWITRAERS